MSVLVGFIRGPKNVIARRSGGVKWCFKCRAKRKHEHQLLSDDPHPIPDDYPIENLSYYEPVWVMRCEGCGGDHTSFPGTM